MKNGFIFLFIASIFILVGCTAEEKTIKIFGEIENFNQAEGLIINLVKEGDSYNNGLKISEINENGSFFEELNIDNGYYNLSYKGSSINLFLEKGYALNAKYKENNGELKATFSGKGSDANNYLIEKKSIKTSDDFSLYKKNEKLFLEEANTLRKALKEKISKFKKEDKIFYKQESKELDCEYAFKLLRYENFHKLLIKDENFKVSPSFPNVIKTEMLKNIESYNNSPTFRKLIEAYYSQKLNLNNLNSSYTALNNSINTVKSIEITPLKDAFLKKIFDNIKMNSLIGLSSNELKQISENIILSLTDTLTIKEVKKESLLLKGNVSASFNYNNNNNELVALNNFKGKYVYIDVWATWCVPCIEEIPSLKKIKKKYKNDNIVFIGLSVDRLKDKQKWKRKIKSLELEGIQLLADNDFKSKFIQSYNISAIPRFIFIDPQGKIISSQAPYPSSEEQLITLLNNYLKQ